MFWNLKVITPPVIGHLVLIWTSFFSSLFLCTSTTVWKINQLQSRNFEFIKRHPTLRIDALKNNKSLLAKADSSVDKILSWPSVKHSNSQTLLLDVVETEVLLSDFAQQERRENADVPGIYSTGRCWNFSNSGFESDCKSQREGNFNPFQNLNGRS